MNPLTVIFHGSREKVAACSITGGKVLPNGKLESSINFYCNVEEVVTKLHLLMKMERLETMRHKKKSKPLRFSPKWKTIIGAHLTKKSEIQKNLINIDGCRNFLSTI